MISVNRQKAIEKLCDGFEHPAIRTLITLATGIPGYGTLIDAADTGLQAYVARYQARKLRVFFEELSKGAVALTEELIQSDDFLHAFFATTKAVVETKREEKIRLFARLLKASCTSAVPVSHVDEFDELFAILEALTLDDWRILLHAEALQTKQGEDHRIIAGEFLTLGFTGESLPSRLSRIASTGCMMELTVSPTAWAIGRWDYQYSRFVHLTPLYFRLKELVQADDGIVF